jgi:hypothetical protein
MIGDNGFITIIVMQLYSTAMDALRGMFGDAVQPYKAAYRTKWSQDPYAGYMSYSFEHVKQVSACVSNNHFTFLTVCYDYHTHYKV